MAKKLSLPSELTIYAVGPTRSLFQGWVAKLAKGKRASALEAAPLTVDGSGVNEVDAAGVQLLLSLASTLAAHKRTLLLDRPSTPLATACATLGVASLLATSVQEGGRA